MIILFITAEQMQLFILGNDSSSKFGVKYCSKFCRDHDRPPRDRRDHRYDDSDRDRRDDRRERAGRDRRDDDYRRDDRPHSRDSDKDRPEYERQRVCYSFVLNLFL